MNDLFAQSTLITGGGIAAALIGLAAYLPKLLNAIKGDRIDGNLLNRITNLEAKSVVQDGKIHDYAVKITRLTVIMMRLEALLVDNGVNIPPDLAAEIDELRESL